MRRFCIMMLGYYFLVGGLPHKVSIWIFDRQPSLTDAPVDVMSKGAHTRTSVARESASGSLTREPRSDIHVYK
jgi:hypothetical protein